MGLLDKIKGTITKTTNLSKSVVYDWLDYSKENVLPGNEDLSKILCRLGIMTTIYACNLLGLRLRTKVACVTCSAIHL